MYRSRLPGKSNLHHGSAPKCPVIGAIESSQSGMYPNCFIGVGELNLYRKVGVLLAQKTGEPALLSTQRDATESASAKNIGENQNILERVGVTPCRRKTKIFTVLQWDVFPSPVFYKKKG